MAAFLKTLALLATSSVLTAAVVTSAFDRELSSTMTRMDRSMAAAPLTGDADHDFLTMMIPHHQAAIDMSQSELQYGQDVRVKRLAQEIVVTQESEISLMRSYLAGDARAK